jgi:hypothetical protein
MTRLRRLALWAAGAGAAVAFVVPSAVAIDQLFSRQAPPASGSACAVLTTRTLDFARHYTVAARQYAAAGPAAGLPRLASSEEIRRCGNPERLLERVGVNPSAAKPAAPTQGAAATKTTP